MDINNLYRKENSVSYFTLIWYFFTSIIIDFRGFLLTCLFSGNNYIFRVQVSQKSYIKPINNLMIKTYEP